MDTVEVKKTKTAKKTRAKLEDALKRLIEDTPLVVKPGTKISPTSVAKEAGIDRVTLYRYHDPILRLIKINKNNVNKSSNSEAARKNTLIVKLRQLAEKAQEEVSLLAKINYRLTAEKEEVLDLLNSRDRIIRDLRQKISEQGKINNITQLKNH